uniref:Uncharacterized protein n=1 Tax=Anguilla anguilla TaxID=7936 RepID=A0A0E9PPQ8_ANGAN
MVSISSNGCK